MEINLFPPPFPFYFNSLSPLSPLRSISIAFPYYVVNLFKETLIRRKKTKAGIMDINHDTKTVLHLSRLLYFTTLSSRTSGIEFWREGVVYFSLEERRRKWRHLRVPGEQRRGDLFSRDFMEATPSEHAPLIPSYLGRSNRSLNRPVPANGWIRALFQI